MIKEGIQSDLTLYTKIYIEKILDKDVIVVKVNEGPNKPYYLTEKGLNPSGVFLRHGNASVQATEETIKKMLIENNDNSFETNISNIQDLHFDYLKQVFTFHSIELDENKLKTLNIINLDNKYTNLGLLLSDECPYSIKSAIFNGIDKLEFTNRREFTGSILKQASDAFEHLDLINNNKGKIVGIERIDTRDYPEYALREALLNAIIHRSYNFTGSILLSIFDDRIEITSLGGLVRGLNIKDIYNGVSETRNPNLANIFYRLKYVESYGTGIGRIMTSYKNYDKLPIITITDNVFKITLFNVNYKDNNNKCIHINNKEDQIIDFLKENNKINRLIVESLLNISKTRANDILNNMLNNNIILKKGVGKNIYYEIK